MERIDLLDPDELIAKNKKFLIKAKKTVATLIIGVSFVSLLPTLEYNTALLEAKNDPIVQNIISNEYKNSRYYYDYDIVELFAKYINKNPNLSDEQKKILIQSFNLYCMNDDTARLYTEETIINMCAVAATERLRLMTEREVEKLNTEGFYLPIANGIAVEEYDDLRVIAHEQLHAILKNGRGSGYHLGGFRSNEGRSLNEGMTSRYSDHKSYEEERAICGVLGLLLGDNTISDYYFNSDLKGLKSEIGKYLNEKKTDELIHSMDNYTSIKRKINKFENKKYEQKEKEEKEKIDTLLKTIFEKNMEQNQKIAI